MNAFFLRNKDFYNKCYLENTVLKLDYWLFGCILQTIWGAWGRNRLFIPLLQSVYLLHQNDCFSLRVNSCCLHQPVPIPNFLSNVELSSSLFSLCLSSPFLCVAGILLPASATEHAEKNPSIDSLLRTFQQSYSTSPGFSNNHNIQKINRNLER